MPRIMPGKVEITTRLDREDYDEFVGNLPLHGAVSWFMREAVKAFNARCRTDPSPAQQICAIVADMPRGSHEQ